MKTTIDLPDDLVREMKLCAVHEGRKLKDLAAELLERSLAPEGSKGEGAIAPVAKTLPVIRARPGPAPSFSGKDAQAMNDWIKVAELDEEFERYEKSLGHQRVDRHHPRG